MLIFKNFLFSENFTSLSYESQSNIEHCFRVQETNIRQLRVEFLSKGRPLFVTETYFVKINDTIILNRLFSSFISPS